MLIPAFLTTIYLNRLIKNSIIFHEAKQEEATAKKEYEKCLAENEKELNQLMDALADINKMKQDARKNVNDKKYEQLPHKPNLFLFSRIREDGRIPEAHQVIHDNYINETTGQKLDDYIKKIKPADGTKPFQSENDILTRCAKLRGEIEAKKRHYDNCRKERLESERELSFNTIEVIASSMVLAGIISGLFPLTIAGVALGFTAKVFEFIDKEFDHKPSMAIRGFFVDVGSKLKNLFRPKPEMKPAIDNQNQLGNPALKSLLQNSTPSVDHSEPTPIRPRSAPVTIPIPAGNNLRLHRRNVKCSSLNPALAASNSGESFSATPSRTM